MTSCLCQSVLFAFCPDKGKKCFVDILDAQWECEGELIPLEPSILNPREFLVYQHGLFLMHTLHSLKLTPAISLQIAASLPNNNYFNNAFRNSFFYQVNLELFSVCVSWICNLKKTKPFFKNTSNITTFMKMKWHLAFIFPVLVKRMSPVFSVTYWGLEIRSLNWQTAKISF